MVDAVWVDCAWVVDGVGWIMRGRLVSFGQITHGTVDVVWADYVLTVDAVWVDYTWMVSIVPALFCPYASTHSLFYAFYFCSVYFFNG